MRRCASRWRASRPTRSARPRWRSANALARGGKLILFGNGGSATDANDWAIDCVAPPAGYRPIPAISLSLEPANSPRSPTTSAPTSIFLRQLIAHARPDDVAVAISTSGGSRNIVAALEEARKRGLLTRRAARLRRRRDRAARPGRLPAGRAVRLHPAHSGSAGVDLSRHARDAGGAATMPEVELFGTASCPYTREMREWLEWTRRRVRRVRRRSRSRRRGTRCARWPAGSARCRCWSRTARSCRSAGRAAAASSDVEPADDEPRCSVRVRGVVQGVGFRPFVFRLARANTLGGLGAERRRRRRDSPRRRRSARCETFLRELRAQPPPAASITDDRRQPGRARRPARLHHPREPRAAIGRRCASRPTCRCATSASRSCSIPAIRAIGYPYINCTNCGPRYSVILRPALRPAQHDDAGVAARRGLRGRVSRSRRSPLPRAAGRVSGVRAALPAARLAPRPSPAARRQHPPRRASCSRDGAHRRGQGTRRLSPRLRRAKRRQPWRRCASGSSARRSRSR